MGTYFIESDIDLYGLVDKNGKLYRMKFHEGEGYLMIETGIPNDDGFQVIGYRPMVAHSDYLFYSVKDATIKAYHLGYSKFDFVVMALITKQVERDGTFFSGVVDLVYSEDLLDLLKGMDTNIFTFRGFVIFSQEDGFPLHRFSYTEKHVIRKGFSTRAVNIEHALELYKKKGVDVIEEEWKEPFGPDRLDPYPDPEALIYEGFDKK
ncbi:MAG: hypothetical protein P1Q69_06965 [Candidatus Thorarchaeota archaeon]|nr:hypothetical protein [Candidatus Thorarchaeota archaeon]